VIPRVRILQIDVPGARLDDTLTFWAEALSAAPRRAPGGFVHLDLATAVPEVHVQPIGDDHARYHLDLEADDLDAEAARLVGLGAREVRRDPVGYVVLEDPAGLLLCVIAPEAAEPAPRAPQAPGRGHLDGVSLDVPGDDLDAEVAFWAAALDAAVEPAEPSSGTRLRGVRGPDGAPLGLEIRPVDASARYRVELSAQHVRAEAARLEAAGAARVAGIGTGVTLADPAGNLLCVVPR
jgi:predicted enzyme related to lactoylglutathione lyase